MDIDENPHAVLVTLRGQVAEAAAARAWITGRAGRVACDLNDDRQQPGWTIARMAVVPPTD